MAAVWDKKTCCKLPEYSSYNERSNEPHMLYLSVTQPSSLSSNKNCTPQPHHYCHLIAFTYLLLYVIH